MRSIARACAAAVPLLGSLLLSVPATAQSEGACRRWSDPLELTGRVVKTLLMGQDDQDNTVPRPVTVLRLDTPLCFSATPNDPEEAAVPPLREFQVTASDTIASQLADAARRSQAVKVRARAMPAVNIHHLTPALLDLTSIRPDPKAAPIADAWQLTTENGMSIAVFPLSQSPTLTRLVISCSGPGDLALRIDDRNGRNPQEITIDAGGLGGMIVTRGKDGRISTDDYSNIVRSYEDYAGMIGGEDGTALLEMSLYAETDNTKPVYNLHGMSRVRKELRARCKDPGAANAPAPTLTTQTAAPARSDYIRAFIALCQRGIPRDNVPGSSLKSCECQADTVIDYARQREPNLRGYPDMLLYSFVSITDFVLKGGNPYEIGGHLQLALMRFPDAAFTNIMRVLADSQASGKLALSRCQ